MSVFGRIQDGWRRFRNQLMGRVGFQTFATAFPLTRPIARRRSRQLFDLIAGFTYSQTLVACVELGLIERLSRSPASLDELARAFGFAEHRLERLLKAAVSLKILERTSRGHYDLGIHGAALIGNPWIAGFIKHHQLLYRDLADPISVVRGGEGLTALQSYWAYTADHHGQETDAKDVSAYTDLMGQSQAAVAREILSAYDFSAHRHLLDIGGSNGSFILAASQRHKALAFTLFDLPAVSQIARERILSARLDGRVAVVEGSFLTDPLPDSADVATLIRVLHDHDDESVAKIMGAAFRALKPDGVLIVAEPFSGIPSIEPVTDAYFGLYFAAMGQGKTRTTAEIIAIGQKIGFRSARVVATQNPLITGILVLRI